MRCIVNVEDAGAVVPPLPSSPFADGEVHEASSLEDSPDGSPPPSNPVASSATVPSLTASTSGTCSPSTVAHSLRTARSLPRRSLPAAVRLSVSPAPRSASPFPREATAPPPTSSSPPPLRAIASRSLPSRAPGSPAHPWIRQQLHLHLLNRCAHLRMLRQSPRAPDRRPRLAVGRIPGFLIRRRLRFPRRYCRYELLLPAGQIPWHDSPHSVLPGQTTQSGTMQAKLGAVARTKVTQNPRGNRRSSAAILRHCRRGRSNADL